jgi:hypothetical protein
MQQTPQAKHRSEAKQNGAWRAKPACASCLYRQVHVSAHAADDATEAKHTTTAQAGHRLICWPGSILCSSYHTVSLNMCCCHLVDAEGVVGCVGQDIHLQQHANYIRVLDTDGS